MRSRNYYWRNYLGSKENRICNRGYDATVLKKEKCGVPKENNDTKNRALFYRSFGTIKNITDPEKEWYIFLGKVKKS